MIRRILLLNFRVLHRLDRWVNRRFTHAGMLVLGGMVAGAVFGVDVRSTSAFQAAAFAGGLLMVAFTCALFLRARVGVDRQLPAYATVGEPVVYSITVSNRRKRPVAGLLIHDRLQERPPSYQEFVGVNEPRRARRKLFGRRGGYPRWASLVRMGRGGVTTESRLPLLPAGGVVRVDATVTALRRGHLRFEATDVARADPFGLVKAVRKIDAPASLLVLPKRYPVAWHEETGRIPDRAGGAANTHGSGGSDEFSAVREYRRGDALRHIHWRSWARLGEPVVKTFLDPSHAHQGLLLDTFLGSHSPERFEDAVSVAASFACRADHDVDRVDLLFVADDFAFASGSGSVGAAGLLEALACVQACTEREPSELADLAVRNGQRLSSCVCVLLDWDQPRKTLVERLRFEDVPVTVFVVCEENDVADRSPGPLADAPQRLCFVGPGEIERMLATYAPPASEG